MLRDKETQEAQIFLPAMHKVLGWHPTNYAPAIPISTNWSECLCKWRKGRPGSSGITAQHGDALIGLSLFLTMTSRLFSIGYFVHFWASFSLVRNLSMWSDHIPASVHMMMLAALFSNRRTFPWWCCNEHRRLSLTVFASSRHYVICPILLPSATSITCHPKPRPWRSSCPMMSSVLPEIEACCGSSDGAET